MKNATLPTSPDWGKTASDPNEKPDIFRFEDHREYLREYFNWFKGSDPTFSHRKLAKLSGYANPGFFNDIIHGRRKVGPLGLERYAKTLGLTHMETEFLLCLLAFTDAKDDHAKEVAFDALARRRNRRFFKRLGHDQTKYYVDFNYPLIRSAIEVCDFKGDYKKLGDFIRPKLSSDSVKRYVRDLCEWGLVAQNKDGKYYVTHSYLEPPPGQRDAMSRMHQAWQTQTAAVLSSMPPSKIHVSTALVTVSEPTYKSIMKHIGKFRDEILQMVRNDKHADRVASISIQLLPRGENG